MNLDDITVEDFKRQFARAFPFLPVYDYTKLYNTGAHVYYAVTELFYDSLQDGNVGNLPIDGDYWVKVADDVENWVTDDDIQRAFEEAKQTFNQSLWGDDAGVKLGYLYLTAFWLVHDMKAAMGGLTGSSPALVSSRSVGNVSESYGIPQAYLDDPLLGMYAANPWGLKYLQMVLPLLRGNIFPVCGRTLP